MDSSFQSIHTQVQSHSPLWGRLCTPGKAAYILGKTVYNIGKMPHIPGKATHTPGKATYTPGKVAYILGKMLYRIGKKIKTQIYIQQRLRCYAVSDTPFYVIGIVPCCNLSDY